MMSSLLCLDQVDDRVLDAIVLRAIRRDDGEAARLHLQAGRPIYYCDEGFAGVVVCEMPNGRRDLGVVNHDGSFTVVACLLPRFLSSSPAPCSFACP